MGWACARTGGRAKVSQTKRRTTERPSRGIRRIIDVFRRNADDPRWRTDGRSESARRFRRSAQKRVREPIEADRAILERVETEPGHELARVAGSARPGEAE